MLTKKVKMYGGYIVRLRTIHDCKCIAAIMNHASAVIRAHHQKPMTVR
jgi:hypothetical protein